MTPSPELAPELRFDVVILDIFSGPDAPGHIACMEFYQEARARLTANGILIVNVGDEPGLTLVRSQAAALRRAMEDVAAFAEAGMFAGPLSGQHHPRGNTGPVAGQLVS